MRESLLKMTQPEAEAILKRSGLAILPMGSVEQHGPHLPCGTDYLASLVIGQQVADRVDALLVPFCPIGVTPFHMFTNGNTARDLISLSVRISFTAGKNRYPRFGTVSM